MTIQASAIFTDIQSGEKSLVQIRLVEFAIEVQFAEPNKILHWPCAEIESPGPSSYLSQTVRHKSAPSHELKIDSTFLYDSLAERAPGVAVRNDLVPELTRDWKTRETMWQSLSLNRWRSLWTDSAAQQDSYGHLMHDKTTRLGILLIVVIGMALAVFW